MELFPFQLLCPFVKLFYLHLAVDLILKVFYLGFQVEHSLLLATIRDRSAIREDMHAPVTDATFGDFKAF